MFVMIRIGWVAHNDQNWGYVGCLQVLWNIYETIADVTTSGDRSQHLTILIAKLLAPP